MVISSIDLKGGHVVQLKNGKDPVIERDDSDSLINDFNKYGEVAVIDLDAALGNTNPKGDTVNTPLLKKLLRKGNVRTGGGVHVVVKKSSLRSNPADYVKEVEDFLKSKGLDASEVKYNSSTTKDEFGQNRQTSPMIPMPGTYQYQKPVTIVNKWDFD